MYSIDVSLKLFILKKTLMDSDKGKVDGGCLGPPKIKAVRFLKLSWKEK